MLILAQSIHVARSQGQGVE